MNIPVANTGPKTFRTGTSMAQRELSDSTDDCDGNGVYYSIHPNKLLLMVLTSPALQCKIPANRVKLSPYSSAFP